MALEHLKDLAGVVAPLATLLSSLKKLYSRSRKEGVTRKEIKAQITEILKGRDFPIDIDAMLDHWEDQLGPSDSDVMLLRRSLMNSRRSKVEVHKKAAKKGAAKKAGKRACKKTAKKRTAKKRAKK